MRNAASCRCLVSGGRRIIAAQTCWPTKNSTTTTTTKTAASMRFIVDEPPTTGRAIHGRIASSAAFVVAGVVGSAVI